jgi:acetyltransferase-like isoleucine patch superfamily enzyme
MIHPLADCMNKNVPESTKIWQFCVIFPNCQIGENCNICSGVFIENDVIIGNNVTIKMNTEICDGVTIEDNVFLGPNIYFTNDMHPKSRNKDWKLVPTRICKGASIGASVTFLPGVVVGENAFVGAGSLVTKDIPAGEIWMGSPARFVRKITE